MTSEKVLKVIVRDKYIPEVANRLLDKIIATKNKNIILFGFCENMRWINRLLIEKNLKPSLVDWRQDYFNFDCGSQKIKNIKKIFIKKNSLSVICHDDVENLKAAISFLFFNNFKNYKTIYDIHYTHDPFIHEFPFSEIRKKAILRAKSMISNQQLFELIQFIKATKDVLGSVVEYGSLYGGSGAILAESLNYFGKKDLYLFDSFNGIPKSIYGMDECWNGAFSDNSYSMVKKAFEDLKNVKIISGNIKKTYKKINGPFSFVYIASDTLESVEILLNYTWSKLNNGGIICICDYGSYPNALPLTMYVDYFFKNKNAKIFYPKVGIFIIKNK